MIIDIIKLASCICSKDGIISGEEIECMKKEIASFDRNFNTENFEDIIEEFFNENKSVIEYCENIKTGSDTKKILDFCHKSASVDGLDPRENDAYIKAKEFLDKQ